MKIRIDKVQKVENLSREVNRLMELALLALDDDWPCDFWGVMEPAIRQAIVLGDSDDEAVDDAVRAALAERAIWRDYWVRRQLIDSGLIRPAPCGCQRPEHFVTPAKIGESATIDQALDVARWLTEHGYPAIAVETRGVTTRGYSGHDDIPDGVWMDAMDSVFCE